MDKYYKARQEIDRKQDEEANARLQELSNAELASQQAYEQANFPGMVECMVYASRNLGPCVACGDPWRVHPEYFAEKLNAREVSGAELRSSYLRKAEDRREAHEQWQSDR